MAELGMTVSLLLAVGSLVAARPARGIPVWAWLSLALACLLVHEAQGAVRNEARRAVRTGRRPR